MAGILAAIVAALMMVALLSCASGRASQEHRSPSSPVAISSSANASAPQTSLVENYNVPAHLLYSKDHVWVRVEGAIATIGITDYAQHEIGDIVYVEQGRYSTGTGEPGAAGMRLHKGEVALVIESVKATEEVDSPVGGYVVAFNGELNNRPELMNVDPYGKGWLLKIKLTEPRQTSQLMSGTDYLRYLRGLQP